MAARFRLASLLIVLAAVWGYAIATDHAAPAWGASRLPSLLFGSLTAVVFSLVVICAYHAVRRRDSNSQGDSAV